MVMFSSPFFNIMEGGRVGEVGVSIQRCHLPNKKNDNQKYNTIYNGDSYTWKYGNMPQATTPTQCYVLFYPCFNKVERGVYWCHLVCPSIRLSTCRSLCWRNRVCLVSSTILAGSILYLHILSSWSVCRMQGSLLNKKNWSLGKFIEFEALALSCFDLGSNMNQYYGYSWGNGGYPQNAGILVVLVMGRS